MEPTQSDLADTLTASFKTMKNLSDQMEGILATLWLMELAVFLCLGVATIYLLSKVAK